MRLANCCIGVSKLGSQIDETNPFHRMRAPTARSGRPGRRRCRRRVCWPAGFTSSPPGRPARVHDLRPELARRTRGRTDRRHATRRRRARAAPRSPRRRLRTASAFSALMSFDERLDRASAAPSRPSSDTQSVNVTVGGVPVASGGMSWGGFASASGFADAGPCTDGRSGCNGNSRSAPAGSAGSAPRRSASRAWCRSGAEQSSSLLSRTIASSASARRKPAFASGGGQPSAPSARATDAS